MLPDIVRRHVVIGRQIFRALAGGDHVKAGGTCPVDHLRRQRRLVAIGERIDHARLARLLGEQRTRQHVRLDIDHDDVLPRRNRGTRVRDTGRGDAGRLDDDLDRVIAAGLGAGGDEAGAPDMGRVPSDLAAGGARPFRVEIGDDGDLQPRHMRHLRQKHRAEFSGADQRDTDGLAGGHAGLEKAVEVHGDIRSVSCPGRGAARNAAPQNRGPERKLSVRRGPRLSSASLLCCVASGARDLFTPPPAVVHARAAAGRRRPPS